MSVTDLDGRRWHDILRHFSNAIHLGLTATPKRDDNVDTYAYFGDPVYVYPMRQGIEDGFLAPCEIIRVFTNIDKAGVLSITEARSQGAKIEVPPGIELKEYYTVEEFERDLLRFSVACSCPRSACSRSATRHPRPSTVPHPLCVFST